ncbi:uncharacterized protein LOC124945661 [Impatiens glandulifera]|uniref:uncharacterized protein LOC124945661 n=1 Tax=Impatiens glandulifera TaxID=253017 RepID=UPI001FB07F35|nr:uncharacterized protein LOC124945661 [Impatiens glandulifera]
MELEKKKKKNPKTDCCCMCGDYGLSSELVNCQTCQFRSQHSYCSNVYPKAESYRICNWCLVQELDDKAKHKTQKSPDSMKKKKNRRNDQDHDRVNNMIEEIKKKKKENEDFDHDVGRGREISGSDFDQAIQKSSPPAGRDRDAVAVGCGDGGVKSRLSRKAQMNVSSNKGGVRKIVRRYKLLVEVSASNLQI